MTDTRIWGTLTKKQVEVLREFLQRFMDICPDADNKIDPADKKRIAKVRDALDEKIDRRFEFTRDDEMFLRNIGSNLE